MILKNIGIIHAEGFYDNQKKKRQKQNLILKSYVYEKVTYDINLNYMATYV